MKIKNEEEYEYMQPWFRSILIGSNQIRTHNLSLISSPHIIYFFFILSNSFTHFSTFFPHFLFKDLNNNSRFIVVLWILDKETSN